MPNGSHWMLELAQKFCLTGANMERLEDLHGSWYESLQGPGINCIDNIVTLATEEHDRFGRCEVSFKPRNASQPFCLVLYKIIRGFKILSTTSLPRNLGLAVYHRRRLPDSSLATTTFHSLPNPELFRLHYLICPILYATGALDQDLDIYRDTKTMAKDGNSVDLLNSALWKAKQSRISNMACLLPIDVGFVNSGPTCLIIWLRSIVRAVMLFTWLPGLFTFDR